MVDYYEDDDGFQDISSFYKRLMNHMFREMQDFEKAIRSGQLHGNWDIKPINKPGMKGYVAQGRFHFGGKPTNNPRPIPRRLLREDTRDSLTDIFDEEEHVKMYMELPGVDKKDIQLDITERFIEVKAKNFAKRAELPTSSVDVEQATASYKNGVLQVTIPKITKSVKDEKKRTIRIE